MVLGSTRYSPPRYPPGYPTTPYPGYTLPTMPVMYTTSVLPRGACPSLNMAVGLKSVGQLSLDL